MNHSNPPNVPISSAPAALTLRGGWPSTRPLNCCWIITASRVAESRIERGSSIGFFVGWAASRQRLSKQKGTPRSQKHCHVLPAWRPTQRLPRDYRGRAASEIGNFTTEGFPRGATRIAAAAEMRGRLVVSIFQFERARPPRTFLPGDGVAHGKRGIYCRIADILLDGRPRVWSV